MATGASVYFYWSLSEKEGIPAWIILGGLIRMVP